MRCIAACNKDHVWRFNLLSALFSALMLAQITSQSKFKKKSLFKMLLVQMESKN